MHVVKYVENLSMCSRRKYLLYFCFIFRMGIQHLAVVNVISLSVLLNVAALNDLEYSDKDMMNHREFIMKIKM